MTLNISTCCFQPVLTSYGEEGTNCWVCSRCKKACVAKAVARTANVQFPKCYRSNMGYLFAIIMLCLVGILLALAAR